MSACNGLQYQLAILDNVCIQRAEFFVLAMAGNFCLHIILDNFCIQRGEFFVLAMAGNFCLHIILDNFCIQRLAISACNGRQFLLAIAGNFLSVETEGFDIANDELLPVLW